MGRVHELRSEDEWAEALSETRGFGGKGMMVDFAATWCGPCQAIAPVYAQLAGQHPALKFVKVDVDELSAVAQGAGVTAMPTFQAYYNGKVVDELRGADPTKLKAMVDRLAGMSTGQGAGHKLGGGDGGSEPAPAAGDDRRARMAAAAEARMRAAAAAQQQ